MSENNPSMPELPVAESHSCDSHPEGEKRLPHPGAGSCCGGQACEITQNERPIPTLCEDAVREQLKQVIDPELFVNIVDLGLVYEVDLTPSESDSTKQDVHVVMTLTSPMCPAGPQLIGGSRQVIEAMEGVASVDVKVVMDPPWSPDRMTEDARDQLNIF